MAEAPLNIKKWEDETIPQLLNKIVESSNQQNNILQAMYELMRGEAPETGEQEDMSIPLNIKLIVGSGNKLGKNTPLNVLKAIFSDWENILTNTIDSDQGITGYKIAKLKSFQPGNTYTFNVQVDPSFTDFRADIARPIQVFLISSDYINAGIQTLIASKFNNQFYQVEDYVKRCIGFVKNNSWNTSLLPTGGSFNITPGNFDGYLHFGALTSNSSEGCIITDYDTATQTFTIGGY